MQPKKKVKVLEENIGVYVKDLRRGKVLLRYEKQKAYRKRGIQLKNTPKIKLKVVMLMGILVIQVRYPGK